MWLYRYCWDRYIKNGFYALILFFLFIVQVIGLNSLADYFFKENELFKFIPIGLRFVIYIVLLLIPNGIVLGAYIKLIATQQFVTVSAFNQFLTTSFLPSTQKWFYAVKYIIAILTNKTEMILWVHPESYMNMHTACAILARRYYFSFFKAPAWLWETLRDNGGSEYKREVANINLEIGKRYVLKENTNIPTAYSDFQNINGLQCFLIDSEADGLENIPDFSAFDVSEGYICLKIKEEDRLRIMPELNKLRGLMAYRDIGPPKLRKIKFRAYIEISHSGLPSWINNVCQILDGITIR